MKKNPKNKATKNSKSIDFREVFATVVTIAAKFQTTLFILVILGGLIFFVLSMMNVLETSSSEDAANQASSTTFDEDTIRRLNELESGDNNTRLQLPTGRRTNPFVE